MSIWVLLAEFLIRGLVAELGRIFADTLQTVKDVARAFPNPWKMADVAAKWATSVIGRALAVPTSGMAEAFIDRLKEDKLHNRVIRVDDAVRLVARAWEEGVQSVTLTDETGIIGVIVGAVAGWFYRTVKKIKLLAVLIKSKDEVEFVFQVLEWLRKRTFVNLWVAAVALVLVVSFYVSGIITMTLLCLVIIKGDHMNYILPQDSKRVWRKRGGVARVNARRGPDESTNRSATLLQGERERHMAQANNGTKEPESGLQDQYQLPIPN